MNFFALEATAPDIDVSAFTSTITQAFGKYFTTDNLAIILIAALGAGVGLAVFWFDYRFIKRKVTGALTKGTI